VDALLQSENLDYILLGTGDGDFLRLVRALQSRGKRVDLLSFANTSSELRREVDNHWLGFLMPGMLPAEEGREPPARSHAFVNEERGFGFLTVRTGLSDADVRDDIFCHIRDFTRDGEPVDNLTFAALRTRNTHPRVRDRPSRRRTRQGDQRPASSAGSATAPATPREAGFRKVMVAASETLRPRFPRTRLNPLLVEE
jgi:hypothetical protein